MRQVVRRVLVSIQSSLLLQRMKFTVISIQRQYLVMILVGHTWQQLHKPTVIPGTIKMGLLPVRVLALTSNLVGGSL